MNTDETLSAALDGECSEAEIDRLLADLDRDPAALKRWSRHCVTRDARDGVRIRADAEAWTAQLMSAVRAEAAPIKQHHPAVAPLVAKQRRPFWQPVTGWAVAASAALVALVVVLDAGVPGSAGRDPDAAASLPPPALVPQASPRDLRMVSNGAEPDEAWLLLEHHNAVASQAMGGALRYARFASHSPEPVRPALFMREEGAR